MYLVFCDLNYITQNKTLVLLSLTFIIKLNKILLELLKLCILSYKQMLYFMYCSQKYNPRYYEYFNCFSTFNTSEQF